MKKLMIIIFSLVVFSAYGQNTYKTEFNNDEESTVEISIVAAKVTVVGTAGNELIIESIGENKPLNSQVQIKDDKPDDDEEPVLPERAKGLKPINATGKDNTGVGVFIENHEDFIRLVQSPFLLSDHYKITIPNKSKLIITDMHHFSGNSKFTYSISNLDNEITVSSLNSNFDLNNIKGPLVLNATNGNADIKYSEVKLTKPISIVTINGYVDLTLPPSLKADVQLHTMNGEAYTDFEVEEESSMIPDNSLPNMQMFHLEGNINGGGPTKVNIQTINGDIFLRKGK